MDTTAATTTQHQRTPETVHTPPPVGGVEATLVTAHQLLNNPPSAHASPSAVEQWRRDVDQLIIAAINTPHHEGGRQEPTTAHSCSPSAVCAPPSARVLHQSRVLPSIVTGDLRDELICRRRGEDSHTTIECHRERRHNIEGRILERDFESLGPAPEAPATRAIHPPSSPADSGGVWCLHHISRWWSGHASSGSTCQRSMTGRSTPPNFYRSTPPPSSL
jgi:hypothetical protein